MIYSESNELVLVKNLMQKCEFEEALRLLNEFKNQKTLNSHEQISVYLLKSQLLSKLWQFNKAHKNANKAYQLSQEIGETSQLYEIYLEMILTANSTSNLELALDFVEKAEDLLKNFSHKIPNERIKREADLLFQKSFTYYNNGEINKAQKYGKRALSLREKLKSNVDIALSLQQLGSIYTIMGEFDIGLKYLERGLNLSKKINYRQMIPAFYNSYGICYAYKGELDESLKYYNKGFILSKELKMRRLTSSILNNMGMVCQQKGNLDNALELFEKSLKISERLNLRLSPILDSLFHLSIEKGDFDSASNYLQRLNELKDREAMNNIIYLVDKAIMLKTSNRARNRVKAEEIFKQIIKDEAANYEMKIIALINLCDLLLIELNHTYDLEILDEVNPYILQLLNLAEKNRSYSLLAETQLLQAKLALLTLDINETRRFLTQAQKIAENYKLHRLAIKISNEHDEFLKHLSKWENLENSEKSLIERMEMAHIKEQMERLIRRRGVEQSDLSDEDPVVLLIISEGGNTLFSEKFVEEWSFKDHLFGGFLTAINTFSEEMFSEGFERAKFGKYTLIMKSIPPFIVCYLFKGKSYLAQQRIVSFINELKRNQKVWKTFNDFYDLNKEIKMKDIPSLEPLVREIFIDKAIPLDI
jgi:tetratricopeptide (TPR) repeat protein